MEMRSVLGCIEWKMHLSDRNYRATRSSWHWRNLSFIGKISDTTEGGGQSLERLSYSSLSYTEYDSSRLQAMGGGGKRRKSCNMAYKASLSRALLSSRQFSSHSQRRIIIHTLPSRWRSITIPTSLLSAPSLPCSMPIITEQVRSSDSTLLWHRHEILTTVERRCCKRLGNQRLV